MNGFKTWFSSIPRVVLGAVAALWVAMNPIVQALMVLMVIDIITGMLSGYVAKQLSSDVSFRGIAKKVLILAVVWAAAVVAPHVGDLPLAEAVAGFYLMHEGLSILENLGEAGLPIPKFLRDALARLNGNSTS